MSSPRFPSSAAPTRLPRLKYNCRVVWAVDQQKSRRNSLTSIGGELANQDNAQTCQIAESVTITQLSTAALPKTCGATCGNEPRHLWAATCSRYPMNENHGIISGNHRTGGRLFVTSFVSGFAAGAVTTFFACELMPGAPPSSVLNHLLNRQTPGTDPNRGTMIPGGEGPVSGS